MARAHNQAQKFGADMAIPDEAAGLEAMDGDGQFVMRLLSAEQVRARSVVIASGARYRRLDVPNLEQFEGSSVHYWASPLEGKLVANEQVALVGAGNSAGQATVYLAGRAAKVWLIVRGRDLEASMSRYLVDRIKGLANVEVVTQAAVSALEGGNGSLEAVRWRAGASGQEVRRSIHHLFLFIGADPNSDWLSGSLKLDQKGYVLTDQRPVHPARRWRQVAQASLPSATSGRALSSTWPRQWVKEHKSFRCCTRISPNGQHREWRMDQRRVKPRQHPKRTLCPTIESDNHPMILPPEKPRNCPPAFATDEIGHGVASIPLP